MSASDDINSIQKVLGERLVGFEVVESYDGFTSVVVLKFSDGTVLSFSGHAFPDGNVHALLFLMVDKILNILTLVGAIGGSTLIALNLNLNFFGYLLFSISSISAVVILRETKVSGGLLWTNIYFSIINLVGMFRYSGE